MSDTTTPANVQEANATLEEVKPLNLEHQAGFPTEIERTIDGKPSGKSLKIVWEMIKRKSSKMIGLTYPSIDVKPTRESIIELLDALGAETLHGILKPKLDQRCYGLATTSYAEFDKDKGIANNWDKEKNIKALADFSASTESINDLKNEILRLVTLIQEQVNDAGEASDPVLLASTLAGIKVKKRALQAKMLQQAARKAERDAEGTEDETAND